MQDPSWPSARDGLAIGVHKVGGRCVDADVHQERSSRRLDALDLDGVIPHLADTQPTQLLILLQHVGSRGLSEKRWVAVWPDTPGRPGEEGRVS